MKRVWIAASLFAGASAGLFAEAVVFPPAFGVVRAGQAARVEWRGLPGRVEEVELLLSVEGRTFPVRVTPQLAARAGALLWRVPNLPSRRARLTIRYGLDGAEIEGEESSAFEILPSADEPPAILAFRQGEWWAQESTEDRFPGAMRSRQEDDRVQEYRDQSPCAGSRSPVAAAARIASKGARSPILRDCVSFDRPALSRKPDEVPARI